MLGSGPAKFLCWKYLIYNLRIKSTCPDWMIEWNKSLPHVETSWIHFCLTFLYFAHFPSCQTASTSRLTLHCIEVEDKESVLGRVGTKTWLRCCLRCFRQQQESAPPDPTLPRVMGLPVQATDSPHQTTSTTQHQAYSINHEVSFDAFDAST